MMKWLIVLVVLVVAGAFFGYPLLNEDTGSECDALERASVRIALAGDDRKLEPREQLLGQFFQGLSKGQFANVAVRNEYPDLPVGVACSMLYWRGIVDPKRFRKDFGKLRP